jgi:pyruvate dehydrogenase E1 component beta subunit
MFVDFLGVCLDQIFNQGGKMRYMFGGKAKVPMVIRTLYGAGFRAAAQHSAVLYSIFTHMPGLKVVAPSTPYNAKGLLMAAIRDDDPVIFMEHLVLLDSSGPAPEGEYVVPLGKAEIARHGKDVTVVAIGRMRLFAVQAAEDLAKNGIDVEVVDPQSLSPLDESTILESVKKTHRLVVVDEGNPRCSVANDIVTLAAQQAFAYLDSAPRTVTAPHTPVPFSPPLEDAYIPSPAKIVAAVKAAVA